MESSPKRHCPEKGEEMVKPATLSEELLALQKSSEEEWLVQLPKLLATHGLEALSAWRDESFKHKHRLVHMAAMKSYPQAIKVLHEMGFDLNVQRDSDKCTPLHLAIFFKKPAAIEALRQAGVDSTLENSYGESADAKYEKLAESKNNIIFLDLELTSGFYDVGEHARILEVAVIITDKDLKELGRGQWTVNGYSADELNALKDFHQKTFRDAEEGGLFPPLAGSPGNGLFSEVLSSTTSKQQVEKEVLKLLQQHCRLPQQAEALSANQKANSNYNHRAINDAESSICMLRWVREHVLVQPAAQ